MRRRRGGGNIHVLYYVGLLFTKKVYNGKQLLINVFDNISEASDFFTFVTQVVSDRGFPLIACYKLARIAQTKLFTKVGIDFAIELTLRITDENNAACYQICFNLPLVCGWPQGSHAIDEL